ncbi:MAG: hypothetical protein JXR31_14740 [Prolixibacteraceae bacterium]|nr:hypothetical protein [Prolixibacteraceae bacterium]MBN2775510.1 hypothetical protein [Prolixibacteraceae bacterium]
MKLRIIFIVVISLSLINNNSRAQNSNSASNNFNIEIPEVALLSLKSVSQGAISISPGAPHEAGLSLDFSESTKSDIWINYSSILPGNINSRNLKARINGNIPGGLKLKLSASGDAGYGNGHMGVPVGEIVLSNTQQTIISGIGSSYTGVGIQKGHLLTYSLEFDEIAEYSELQQNSYTLTVLFTLIDQN